MRMIDRKKAIEAIMDLENCPNGLSDTYDKARIIAELEEVPTVDAVEVVRCKDCIYYERLNENEYYCDAIYRNLTGDDEGVDFEPPEDHFCAYGVRREADG